VLGLADAPESARALAEATEAAKAAGIFGSPSFVVGEEIFWGDDRLDDAIAWFRHGCLG
jgi:2-hydroxychromene-2-carboxylate isomerase